MAFTGGMQTPGNPKMRSKTDLSSLYGLINQDFFFLGSWTCEILKTSVFYQIYCQVGSFLQTSLDFEETKHGKIIGSHFDEQVQITVFALLPTGI